MLRYHLDAVTRYDARGWVFADDGSSVEVEAWCKNECIARGTAKLARPDVQTACSNLPASLPSGFSIKFDPTALDKFSDNVVYITILATSNGTVTKLGEAPIFKMGVLKNSMLGIPGPEFELSPFPFPIIKAIDKLFPLLAIDELWEMEVANRIVSLADWASEAPVFVDYFRFLRSVWSHCLFVTRYFPSVNSRRSLGDKDFPSAQTTALEMMSIAHQIYVLKSYEVVGDVAEFGCFKGFSSSVLSYACKLIDIKMQIFDFFEGLPPSNSVYYSAGDFSGDLQEVKENVRIYGSLKSVDFHKGYFDNSLKALTLPQLKLIWMDLDLEKSATDVMSIADRLNPKGNIFCHECVPSNFMNGEIRAERGPESVIPPIIDKFEALGAPLRGAFITGYTGAFWRAKGGCPVLGGEALQRLVNAL